MATRNRSSQFNDISERGSAAMESAQEATGAVRDMAAEKLSALRDTASEYVEQGRAKAREYGETVQHQVQEEPMKALLIAAAAGFLFGVLFTRR